MKYFLYTVFLILSLTANCQYDTIINASSHIKIPDLTNNSSYYIGIRRGGTIIMETPKGRTEWYYEVPENNILNGEIVSSIGAGMYRVLYDIDGENKEIKLYLRNIIEFGNAGIDTLTIISKDTLITVNYNNFENAKLYLLEGNSAVLKQMGLAFELGVGKWIVEAEDAGQYASYDTINIKCKVLGKPNLPSGETEVCANALAYYEISELQGADSYVWSIFPNSFGIIEGDSNRIVVDWSYAARGEAKISVAGRAACGLVGNASDSLEILVKNVPLKPDGIIGTESPCLNVSNIYSTNGAEYASSYEWKTNYNTEIVSNGKEASIKWMEYNGPWGEDQISVSGVNECGIGLRTFLDVTQYGSPKSVNEIYWINNSAENLCLNPGNSSFCFNEPYVLEDEFSPAYYIITIDPSEAGIVIGDSTNRCYIIDWSDSFSGTANIYVTGANICGLSERKGPISVDISICNSDDKIDYEEIKIVSEYPNSILIDFSRLNKTVKKLELNCFDGNIVASFNYPTSTEIEIKNLRENMYLVRILCDEGLLVRKIGLF